MKAKKILVAIVALVLVVACTVGGTLAWLSAQADAVTNTFTVGKIEIELTETYNTNDNQWVGKIVPGAEQAKDPTVTVKKGSEKCYVYALVDNQMLVDTKVAVTPNINTTDWVQVASSGTKTLYRYKAVVDAASADVECPVFTKVTYNGTLIDETNIAALGEKTITVDAYAHQSENVDQADADAAAKTHFGFSA